MKMYIKPLSKEHLARLLAVVDLTDSPEPHALKMVYEKLADQIRTTHPKSSVQLYRKDPVVTVQDNYDRLLISTNNISRSSTYTHYVDSTHLLRTHTSAHIPSLLHELAARNDWEDVVILLPGLAYRRDISDKKHVSEVHMLEMWRVVKNSARTIISNEDLLHVVRTVADVAAPGWDLRIVASPHPYTRGGIEVNAVKGERDIEIGECGLIKEQILANAGLDPSQHSGWAMGIGLDRLVMTLKDLPDIRYLRSGNPQIAAQMRDLSPYQEVSDQPAIARDISYSVPNEYVREDISEDIRSALGNDLGTLESVELLSETSYADLPEKIRKRLGCGPEQKNVLVRVILRHLERSLTDSEANAICARLYQCVNKGESGYSMPSAVRDRPVRP